MKSFAKYFALIFLSLPNPTANPSRIKPNSTGSVVYFDVTQDEIVVAADSRRTDLDNGSYSDSECKITAFGNRSIFAEAGIQHSEIELGPPRTTIIWDTHDQARLSFARARELNTAGDIALAAAQDWTNSAKRIFQPALTVDPAKFTKEIAGDFGGIAEAVFASSNIEGQLSVVHVLITFVPKVGETPTITSSIEQVQPGNVYVMGFATIAQEFDNMTTDRSKTELDKWARSLSPADQEGDRFRENRAIQYVKWTIQYADTQIVGGSVDAIVLDRNGVRWLARKDNCNPAD